MDRSTLLSTDGIINLILGVLLMAFPGRLVALLGIPSADSSFYPTILGGVLFGIGLALIMERHPTTGRGAGLGLSGAVAINLCGGLVLCFWLVFGDLALPVRGLVFLWFLVVLLLGISAMEILSGSRS